MESYWVLLVCVVSFARADYPCICSYNVEVSVYEAMSDTSKNIGYMYALECKERLLTTPVSPGWCAIAYKQKVGFVHMSSSNTSLETKVCQGTAQASDTALPQYTMSPILHISNTTPIHITSVPSSQLPTNAVPSTQPPTTTVPTFTVSNPHGIISGKTELCPVALRSYAVRDGSILGQYDNSCYEIVPHRHMWQNAEKDCRKKGGHLAHIINSGEQQFLYSFLRTHYNHLAWIGLHDLKIEGHYEWTSGNIVNYTNWLPGRSTIFHSSEDCVYLNPRNHGYWDDDECGTDLLSLQYNPYVCQYAINPNTTVTGTVNPHGYGDTHLCPSSVQHHASVHHGTLAQYGQSCYEFLPKFYVKWSHGEAICQHEGGHLAHIVNANEQNFIQSFMLQHSPHHAVWIGLNDKVDQNNFTWTSGVPVTYTNWINDHSGIANYRTPDCTLFIPYQLGHWDDVPCGQHLALFGDIGQKHPILCQFATTKASSSMVVG